MKKLLLGLGSVVSATVPVVAVVACGDDNKETPKPDAQPTVSHTPLTASQMTTQINAFSAVAYNSAKDKTALLQAVSSWGIASDIAGKHAKSNDYEKAGSWIDGQFAWAAFTENPFSLEDLEKNVAAVNTALNEYKTYNAAHTSTPVKLGAAITGKAYDTTHQRDHQVNKAELLALLNRQKTLVGSSSVGLTALLDDSIAIVNTLTDFT